jgi:hypothetical protein
MRPKFPIACLAFFASDDLAFPEPERAVGLETGLAHLRVPMIMTVTTLLTKIGDFEANTVRVFEEGGYVIGRVFWIAFCFRGIDPALAQPLRNSSYLGF